MSGERRSETGFLLEPGWHRTYGNTGWYNGTWGGGWYMIDSTWVRSYNNKGVYTAGEMRATTVRGNTNLCIGSDCRTSWPSGAVSDDDWTIYSDRLVSNRDDVVAKSGNWRLFSDGKIKAANNKIVLESNGSIKAAAGKTWLDADGDIRLTTGGLYAKTSLNAGGSIKAGTHIDAGSYITAAGNIEGMDIFANDDLIVADKIYAFNQGWSDVKDTYPGTAYCGCDDGWYVAGINFNGDGDCAHVKCASPFKKSGGPGSSTPGPSSPDTGCFTGDTKVLMANGSYKEIKNVYAGDYILTKKSPDSNELVKARVYKSMSYEGWDGYLLINNKLKVTTNHKIYANGEWKVAGEIEIGDRLINEKGEKVIIESIEKVNQPITVYNIEVERYATYFADGVYVHNVVKEK